MVDIAPEPLAEMKRGSNAKQQFVTEAMQRVAEQMQLKPKDRANFSTINSCASVFAQTIYTEKAMETGSFGSNQSEELKRMYQETRANSFCLRACINEVKQSTSMSEQQTGNPPPSGSAAPPTKSQRARRDPEVGHCRDCSLQ